MAEMKVIRLIGVYAADGGLRGELSYLAGRYLKGQHCELCDITHSPVRRRREWDIYTAHLSVPFDLVHRNERDGVTKQATDGAEPCIAAETAGGAISIIISSAELTHVNDVQELSEAVKGALRSRDLYLST